MGLYLFDAKTKSMELLFRDPQITSSWPIPLRAQRTPPVLASTLDRQGPQEGRFLLANVYSNLKTVKPGDIKALRIVAVPPKTHPTMNSPVMGIMADDPGKCVLGTVPVEPDGSAYFRVPAGVIVFFQALDARGIAVQTMRTITHVQPGQTLSCIGCHESRVEAPTAARVMAARREPSKIAVGPEGSWPYRFDRLVQPVLDRDCVQCHAPGSGNERAAQFDLTAEKSYASLTTYGSPSLVEHVRARYLEGRSLEGGGAAALSTVLAKISCESHPELELSPDGFERLVTWLDTLGQVLGSFSEEQERQLLTLREQWRDLLDERTPPPALAQRETP
jgi:hypothetical protein